MSWAGKDDSECDFNLLTCCDGLSEFCICIRDRRQLLSNVIRRNWFEITVTNKALQ